MEVKTEAVPTRARRVALREWAALVVRLFKLRIVLLLLAAAIGGAFLGAQGMPPLKALIAVVVSGTLAAGGASALNEYLEQRIDALMRRTRQRPLPAGQIAQPTAVLWIAVAMIAAAVLGVLPDNPIMALYLALGALIYIGVYTVWLKPRSVLNIVIGGAAGSMAVMTGGAAVGAPTDAGVIALALLVFLWTPAHFWALALFYRDDYALAGVPMLPVHVNDKASAGWISLHVFATALAALALAAHPALGWAYLIPTLALTVPMLVGAVRLVRRPERQQALRLFILSNLFLLVILAAVVVATVLHQLISHNGG